MVNIYELKEFVSPYYEKKDIMHDLSHIERVLKCASKFCSYHDDSIDKDAIILGGYFHGFIYKEEAKIVKWLKEKGLSEERINFIIKVSWESQKKSTRDNRGKNTS